MLTALDEQNGTLLKKVEDILAETETIVGTSKFFGEIWKAVLRPPRCRLPALKYLDRKIPRNHTNDVSKIHLSKYQLVIKQGMMQLESAKEEIADEREPIDEREPWYLYEKQMLR